MSEKRLIKLCFIIIAFIIIIFSIACITFAETLDGLKDEREQISTKEDASEIELEIVKGELSGLQVEIAELNNNIITLELEIEDLTKKDTTLSKSIETNKANLEILSNEYLEKKELLEKRLIEMYKAGDTQYLDVILASSSIVEFISNYYIISELIESDTNLLELVYNKKIELESKELTLEKQKDELSEARELAEKKRISLSNMSVVKNSYISKLTSKEKKLQDEITEYQRALKELENDIAAITIDSSGTDYVGGIMRWPVPGYTKITSPFGMRTHPITGVYKLHTGTDISAPKGANFIAAADGVVVKACYNTAYGNMVMIDHGGGIVTLYAHGSSIEVSKGDYVKQGQTVLKVGSTGYATGAHAHFEVRVNGEYKNPMNYVSSK